MAAPAPDLAGSKLGNEIKSTTHGLIMDRRRLASLVEVVTLTDVATLEAPSAPQRIGGLLRSFAILNRYGQDPVEPEQLDDKLQSAQEQDNPFVATIEVVRSITVAWMADADATATKTLRERLGDRTVRAYRPEFIRGSGFNTSVYEGSFVSVTGDRNGVLNLAAGDSAVEVAYVFGGPIPRRGNLDAPDPAFPIRSIEVIEPKSQFPRQIK